MSLETVQTLGTIAQQLGAELRGDPSTEIAGIASLGSAQPGQITHLSSATYKKELAGTQASAVILKAEDADLCPVAALVVENPYLTFARVTHLFKPAPSSSSGVDASASIATSAEIGADVSIGPNVVVGEHARIGERTRIGANTVVGAHCVLGADVVLSANVTLYSDVKVGARSIIHSGAIIGADGFGYTPDERGAWQEIAQLGGVTIGADVSIGACTCIDRGALEDTVIEDGVKIDNQVQIGHNCRVGAHSLLCGMVGFAGSTTVGKHCVFGGRSGAGGDHPINVCDGVMVSSCTVLSQSVDKPGIYSGSMLFHEHGKWRRNALRFASLDELFKRVGRLEKWRKEQP